MASTSPTLMLLGLLVASFCFTANAARELQETSKLNLGAVLDPVTGLVDDLVGAKGCTLNLNMKLDLTSAKCAKCAMTVLVENGMGKTYALPAVPGVVNAMKKPMKVYVKADKMVVMHVVLNDVETVVPLDLGVLNPVVDTVTGVVDMALNIVEGVVDGVNAMTVTDAVGNVIATVGGAVVDPVTNLLDNLVGADGGILNLNMKLDLTSVTCAMAVGVVNGMGKTYALPAKKGAVYVTKKPMKVYVKPNKMVVMHVKVEDTVTAVPVDLGVLNPVVDAVTGVVDMALNIVEGVVDGVNTMTVTDVAGNVIAALGGL